MYWPSQTHHGMTEFILVENIGGYIILRQAGAVDYGSHLPVPVAISSGEVEYISATVACMKASHIRMLEYDFKYLGTQSYDLNNLSCEP